jgi:hypothetical protein
MLNQARSYCYTISGVNRTQTVKALERILDILSKQGYKFVTVSELIHQSVKENTGTVYHEKQYRSSQKDWTASTSSLREYAYYGHL